MKSRPQKGQRETSLKPSHWLRSDKPYGSLQQAADGHLINGESIPAPDASVTLGSKGFFRSDRRWLIMPVINLSVIL